MTCFIVSDIQMEKFLVKDEKFCLTGVSDKLSSRKFQLTLPRGKHFEVHAVKNCENETSVQELLKIAVNKEAYDAYHNGPFGYIKGERVELPRTLQEILSKNPFPISQGPVMPPIDCHSTRCFGQRTTPKSISEVLTSRTIFSHNENQSCYEWSPVSSGVSSWDPKLPTYNVGDATFSVQGAASTVDMGVVYSCENCDKSFKRKSDLKRHHVSAHCDIDIKKKLKCPVCDKKFSRKFVLNSHTKRFHE